MSKALGTIFGRPAGAAGARERRHGFVYARLLLDGERKSIEPWRTLPEGNVQACSS